MKRKFIFWTVAVLCILMIALVGVAQVAIPPDQLEVGPGVTSEMALASLDSEGTAMVEQSVVVDVAAEAAWPLHLQITVGLLLITTTGAIVFYERKRQTPHTTQSPGYGGPLICPI